MANENLKDALRTAGLTSEQFAQIIDVDPKTVQRWVSGRTPYPRHRATIARALDLTEHELWPDDVPPPIDAPGPARQTAHSPGDVIGSWGEHTDPTAPDPIGFITNATKRVDLLDDGRGLLSTPGVIDALLERARAGCRVRVLTYSPGRELQPLIGHEPIPLRVFEAPPGHTVIRAGDQMLVTFSFAGDGDQPPPLLQLRRDSEGGLFDRLADHYQLLSEHADETITDDQQLAAYLIDYEDNEDSDERLDTNHAVPPAEPSPPTSDRGSSTVEQPTPRRWPRRTS